MIGGSIKNIVPAVAQITKTVVRGQATKPRLMPGTNIPYPPLDPKFVATCKKFQADNDLPVHLKGGPMDAILIKICWLGIILGTMGSAAWASTKLFKH